MRLSGVLNPEHEISAVRYSVCLPERFVKCQQVPGGLFPRELFYPFEPATSGIAEVADVTTGVPQAIASSWGMPKLSRSEV